VAYPPGGQVITIDPNNPSQFIPQDGQVILVPVPANTNVNAAVKPSPTPKGNNANATAVPSPTPTNAVPKTTPETKPTPKNEKPPAKPAEQPKPSPPAATEKRPQSGTEQESQD
jgi:hypothetical protein